ncbi:protease inhibitor I42 family protein [Methanococcus aeolicus]|uniref:protease inhibitor I42 family protein n=1 Tax=Methanococcus aeolicus TaxID=42879 RepID=UPI00014FC150|nr:protease inhibitor I42 family protein [Methanococcus aeolicus]
MWDYVIDNNEIINITANNYSTTNNGKVGSGGTHHWNVVGLKKGHATIIFNYNLWESDSMVKTVRYEITVE